MEVFNNEFACLTHYKTSVKGKVIDYVINFNQKQHDINDIVNQTLSLVEELFQSFKNKRIIARIVAKVNFSHVNMNSSEESVRPYHFPSYNAEQVEDVEDFFIKHMMKIASRLDSFAKNGSNLIMKNIEHIHIHLSFC